MTVEQTRLGKYFNSRREKGVDGLPTFSVTLDRGLVRRDSIERRTETNLEPKDHLRVRPGDIAYNMMRMWQGASGLSTEDAIVSPAYVVLQPKPNTDPLFASYLLKHPQLIHLLWAYSYGLTNDRLRLYFNDFKRIPWELPPLPEQKKIAEILSTWDKAIETAEKLLANAEAHKKALMQQLLTGKQRLRGFEGEWREVRLRQVAHVDQSSLNSKTSPDFGFRYISLSDVEPGRISSNLPKMHFSDAPSRARRKIQSGDILFSTVRPNLLGFARVGDEHADCIASTGFAVISCKQVASSSYVYHYLFSRHVRSQIHGLVVGSNYPAVNSKEVKNLRLQVPDPDEQAAIAAVLDSVDGSIVTSKQQIQSLRTEKRALMQQLLTGRRRVRT